MKSANACNPILDTFRTISRCRTKLQIAPTVTIGANITREEVTSRLVVVSHPALDDVTP